jgi:hypothetical protein
LLRVGLEIHALQRSLDGAEVGVGLDLRDQQNVNVGRAEMLGNQLVVAHEQLGHQATQHDEEHIVVAQLMQKPHERELSASSCLAGSPLIHPAPPRWPARDGATDR